jgi:hypothetical protein
MYLTVSEPLMPDAADTLTPKNRERLGRPKIYVCGR